MALHCYVIPQAVAARVGQAVRRIVHRPARNVGHGHAVATRPAPRVMPRPAAAPAPSASCAAPLQALRAMQRLAGLPAAGLVAGGLALGAAGAGLADGAHGGGGRFAAASPGGTGGFPAAGASRATTPGDTPAPAAVTGDNTDEPRSDSRSRPLAPQPDGPSTSPDFLRRAPPQEQDKPVSVPEPGGIAWVGFAAALGATGLVRARRRA